MNILGINAFHGDSSAAIVVNGKLTAAVEEERFRRIKHWAGFPSEAIKYCLEFNNLTLLDIDCVAINQDSKANLWKKTAYTFAKRPDLGFIIDKIKNRREREGVDSQLEACFPGQQFSGKVVPVEHHIAHLSSTFHVSPFDEAVLVSIDGFGDFASGAWGIGKGTEITVDKRIYFPHSMGSFYQALTQYLGFNNYGDEYKVMGLAPYGKPKYLDQMREIVTLCDDGGYKLNLKYFKHHIENVVQEWSGGSPVFGQLYSDNLESLLGDKRQSGEELNQKHFDIAHSIQAMYEETFFHLLSKLHDKYQVNNLALSGGCAMNSVANGKVYRNSSFKKVYIQSAAGDAGGAIGAAYSAWYSENLEAKREFIMDHAYYGPSYTNQYVEKLVEDNAEKLDQEGCASEIVLDEDELFTKTAKAIADGKVIGWFQGRLEWGPRALGNRSILCDPRRSDMKDILNLKIKRRESFRPFAPSILRDKVVDWFEEDDDVPFMMKVFQIKEDKRSIIPAVTHVDGSGRLQTVFENTNSRYYRLISEFEKLTNVPILLNTSFNENEPVVCKPDEALACFLRTKMDVLVMENYIITRKD